MLLLANHPIMSVMSSDIGQVTDAMRELLGRQLYAILCSRNADGSTHAVPVIYQYSDGQLFVATSSATHKARNVAARPEVTITFDDRENLRWVSATGHAELITGTQQPGVPPVDDRRRLRRRRIHPRRGRGRHHRRHT
jgi:nitroimidazol reductase NimA-like FMN-containing flavoprotein (pyridoxamine 5'-phosphate oxidase superfamily)